MRHRGKHQYFEGWKVEIKFKGPHSIKCGEINQHMGACEAVILDLCSVSDSLWRQRRDMKAWPPDPEGGCEATGCLNNCRSRPLKRVVSVDKLQIEGPALHIYEIVISGRTLSRMGRWGAAHIQEWMDWMMGQTKSHQLCFVLAFFTIILQRKAALKWFHLCSSNDISTCSSWALSSFLEIKKRLNNSDPTPHHLHLHHPMAYLIFIVKLHLWQKHVFGNFLCLGDRRRCPVGDRCVWPRYRRVMNGSGGQEVKSYQHEPGNSEIHDICVCCVNFPLH